MTVRHSLVAICGILVCAGCSGILNPEAGMPVPKDPGNVMVRVSDQAGNGVRDVAVEILDIPNSVGTFYGIGQRTGADGTTTFSYIDAGTRRVSVTPPAGFVAGPDGLTRQVEIVKNATVIVDFRITRQ